MSFRCSVCNTTFIDEGSLKVHYNYSHGARPAEPDADPSLPENNNNNNNNNSQHFFKYENSDPPPPSSTMNALSPGAADGRDFHLPNIQQQHYDLPQSSIPPHLNHYDNFHLNHEFQSSAAAAAMPGSPSYPFGVDRYHPYYKQQFREPLQAPQNHYRCEKCQIQFPSQDVFIHHLSITHGIHVGIPGSSFPQAGLNGNSDPSKILDLDSHKVHVYQHPGEENRGDILWREDKKFFQHQQTQLVRNGSSSPGDMANGGGDGGGTPLHSVSTTTNDSMEMHARSPYYDATPPAQISSTENSTGRSSSKSSSSSSSKNSNGNSWKSNEARRPKTYNCSACNKWFTSSGHLKRHYNTTLHKNAVKTSGVPDPATLPVSVHHHPHKDPSYGVSQGPKSKVRHTAPVKVEPNSNYNPEFVPRSSPQPQPQPVIKLEPTSNSNSGYDNGSFSQSPNLITGPSDLSGGLLHHPSYTQSPVDQLLKSPRPPMSAGPSDPTSYMAFGNHQQQQPPPPAAAPFFQSHMSTTAYPNFQSPHVSTTSQVTPILNNHIGNLADDENVKLPSFACIQKNVTWNAAETQMFLALDTIGNVGGAEFSTKDVECLFKNVEGKQEGPGEPKEAVLGRQCQPEQRDEDTRVSSSTERVTSNAPFSEEATATKIVFSCGKCNKFFNKACYLTQHNKSFHSGFKPFKCVRCGKRFVDNVQHKIHTDKHAGDKPHKCDICPKAFNHKTDLRRHACLHTNVRPYNCDICSKGFIRKDHMLKHRETHQNRRSVHRKIKGQKVKKKELAEVIEMTY